MAVVTGRAKSWLRVIREEPAAQGTFLISPTMIYLFLFLLLPLLLVVVLSVVTRGPYGNVVYRLNFENYTRLLDSLYLRILGYSLFTATATTLATILIGYPLAYYIARASARQRSTSASGPGTLRAASDPAWAIASARAARCAR